MDIEMQKKENALLKRVEVQFRVAHTGETTPKRDAVRTELAKVLNAKKDLVVIERMETEYGQGVTRGSANVYESADQLKALEHEFLLKRHGMTKVKPKKEKPAETKEG